ncbi:AAA family ATPase [Sphingomonas sp.]|uniref:AAA family ATPase n=1 Tax=Sphingomonas sp. TaxID=28214 RepID=UPI0025DF070A|nr:AAA family ATPase [Sphingomonas sp.]
MTVAENSVLARIAKAEPAGDVVLTPGQAGALAELEKMAAASAAVGLWGLPGAGKSTVLRAFAERHGGQLVTLEEIVGAFRLAPGDDLDRHIFLYVAKRLQETDLLLVDSAELWSAELGAQGGLIGRNSNVDLLFRLAETTGRRLVLAVRPFPVSDDWGLAARFKRDHVALVQVPPMRPADYAAFAETYLGERVDRINFRQVFAQFGSLTGYQLRAICRTAASHDTIDTPSFIEIVEEMAVRDSLNLGEVEQVTFENMPGTEALARVLDTHVVLPLTNGELADQLELRAKRGVLLYGPPGTGKTSIGRALAHRLKGRFFLIDGSVKTEPAYAFAATLQSIAAEAMKHSPCVLFIDDADLLFGIAHVAGLTRYLLTLLDGLVGDTASKVCVMMTAMDPRKIPEAVLRSGRVELWLEVKPADCETRSKILRRWMSDLLPGVEDIDYEQLGSRTEGFTPADLRRVASDARTFYAADRVVGRPVEEAGVYVEKAIQDLVETRRAMAINLSDPSLRVG